jgi:hypothetical protein
VNEEWGCSGLGCSLIKYFAFELDNFGFDFEKDTYKMQLSL